MTRAELVTALKNKISIVDASDFYSNTVLQGFVNDAHIWCASLHNWDALYKKSALIETVEDQEAYDVPESEDGEKYKVNGIDYLQIDDEDNDDEILVYRKYLYKSYLDYTLLNPDGDKKMFTENNDKIYIWPIPGEDDLEVYLYGYVIPDSFTADADTTFFHGYCPEGEQALLMKAVALALDKADRFQEAEYQEQKARAVLESIFKKQRQRASMNTTNTADWTNKDYFDPTFNIF